MSDVRTDSTVAPAARARSKGHGHFIWYELMTPDPEGARAFYDAVAGWSVGEPHDEIGYRMIARGDGRMVGGVLPLSDEMRAHGARPAWLGYVAVTDVDGTLAEAEALGGRVYMGPREIDDVGRIAMIADAEGNPIYVMTPTPPPGREGEGSAAFSTEAIGSVGWNELSTSDPAAARRFYGELFGWESNDFMDMGEYGEYRFWDFQGTRIGAVCGVMPGGTGGWRYYVQVPSIAASIEALKSGGGEVLIGPHQVPTGDHIVIGKDPQGAEFALVGKL